jgi:hypothetical protein
MVRGRNGKKHTASAYSQPQAAAALNMPARTSLAYRQKQQTCLALVDQTDTTNYLFQ